MKGLFAVLGLCFLLVPNEHALARPAVDVTLNSGLTSFKFEVANNSGKITEDIVCNVYGDSLVVGIIPYQVNQFDLVATFATTPDISNISVGGVTQQAGVSGNDFNQEVEYVLTSPSSTRKWKVVLIYTGLPVVYVYTQNNNPIVSKDDYLNGQLKIYPNSSDPVLNVPTQIRGRGNSTWVMPKKPYKIKLNAKASLLGMPADKEWVLLANYSDKTLIRTSAAFELSHRFDLAYEPRSKHVELILNGQHLGNYLLSEQIKVAKNRVDIEELDADDEDEEKITGGYLLEVDFRKDADFWFESKKKIPFTIKSPEEITAAQLVYIRTYVQKTEDVLFSSFFADPVHGYAKYIDVNSFINWYWVNEIFKTTDANFLSSVFLYKNRNEKLKIGPVWDFDGSSGNVNRRNLETPGNWWIRDKESVWIERLFQDAAFKELVYARWNELKESQIKTLLLFIDEQATQLQLSQKQNFNRWPILDSLVWPNAVATGSYQGEIEYFKTFLKKRMDWIDFQINQPGLMNFNLISPDSHDRFIIENDTKNPLQFSWEPSVPGVIYKWILENPSGNSSAPLLSIQSAGYGFDQRVRVNRRDIDLTLKSLNVKKGDSLNLKWTVVAQGVSNSIAAVQPFTINLIRKRMLSHFNLITPVDKEVIPIDIGSEASIVPITFSWQPSNAALYYTVSMLDEDSGQVIYQSPSIESGNTFVLSSADQIRLLSGMKDRKTYSLKWKVKAYEKEDSISSEKDFGLRFTNLINNTNESSSGLFEIYPNPGTGQFFVQRTGSNYYYIRVSNLLGALVKEVYLDEDNLVDLSDLNQGIYIVQANQGTNTYKCKLIINR
ncbi:MAG TPA: CotH kinase family protein [Cyclobacteriaceae bacterium]